MAACFDVMMPADGRRVCAVIFMMMGEQDLMQFFFIKQLDYGFLHMTLAGINDESIEDIQVYRHEWRTDRAITKLDRLNVSKLLNFYYVHNRTGLRVARSVLRDSRCVIRVAGYGLNVGFFRTRNPQPETRPRTT
ncbi:hypothetical protein ACFL2S_11930 [Thermodesulfobacteriota bacterium]